jgi:hypothetical protein
MRAALVDYPPRGPLGIFAPWLGPRDDAFQMGDLALQDGDFILTEVKVSPLNPKPSGLQPF